MMTDGKGAWAWSAAWREAGVLLLAAVLAGLCVNALRPDGLPLATAWEQAALERAAGRIRVIDTAEALRMHRSGALFLDAREAEAFGEGHVPGARSLPADLSDQDLAMALNGLPAETPLVLYCEGTFCGKAETLAKRAARMGAPALCLFPAGLEGWLAAGGGLEAGS